MALGDLYNSLVDTLTHVTEDGSKVVDRKGFIKSSGLAEKVREDLFNHEELLTYTYAYEHNEYKERDRLALESLTRIMPDVSTIKEWHSRVFYNMLLTYTLNGVVEDVENMINNE